MTDLKDIWDGSRLAPLAQLITADKINQLFNHSEGFRMNRIHQAFAGEPALPLTLQKLFAALDPLEPQERYEFLSPVFQVVLMRTTYRSAANDFDTAYHEIYQQFKAKCLSDLRPLLHQQFLAYSIVAQALAWLHVCADERHLQAAIDHQKEQIQQSERALKLGKTTQQQHAQLVRDCEERQNNLPSDRTLAQEKYDAFCEKIVKQFLYYSIEE